MKVLVVYAHPNPESFNSAIFQKACETLEAAGHDVHTVDLYEENFQPVMDRDERERYMTPDNIRGLEDHAAKLRWAEALIMIYPTWWMGPPAIFKGWLDRVWLPGIVATFGPDGVKPGLTNLKKIMVITTQGSSWLRMTLIGNPPRKMFRLLLRSVTGCRDIQWLALYSMDKNSEQDRKTFLDKVQNRLNKL